MRIQKYQDKDKNIWDLLVSQADNGHFMFKRDYMDYHRDRFFDCSYFVYLNEEPIAVFPGCKQDNLWNSHGGLTFGGLIINSKNNRILQICEIYRALFEQLRNDGFHEAFIKPLPAIYHIAPCEGELFALSNMKNIETYTEITTTIDLRSLFTVSKLRKRQYKKALKHSLSVQRDSNYTSFWEVLSKGLESKYDTEPVHTSEEMIKLAALFPNNIALHRVLDGQGHCIGGTVIFKTETLWHAQYISSTDDGMEIGALDFLFISLIEDAKKQGLHYFDFGISTEKNGTFLNSGLAQFKEGFGGRSFVHRKVKLEV